VVVVVVFPPMKWWFFGFFEEYNAVLRMVRKGNKVWWKEATTAG